MVSANFPTMAEMLEEFAAGMREDQDRKALLSTVDAMNRLSVGSSAMPVSPPLRNPPVSYADFMAGRNQQKDASQ